MTEALVLEFLRAREPMLNIKGIADAAGLNPRTLLDYISGARGKRGLPSETVMALVHAIEGLRAPWSANGAPLTSSWVDEADKVLPGSR